METGLTRTLTFLVLGCLLLTGVAVASILGRDSVPMLSSSEMAQSSIAVSRGPVSNTQGKNDRLQVAGAMMASLAPQPSASELEPLRRAFANEGAVEPPAPTALSPVVVPSPKAKAAIAAKPQVQKNYTLLSDAQIAAIKGRLNLTASQEAYWPDIETALRAIARKLHETRQSRPGGAAPPIDPDSAEVAQLKSAAMPLLFQLREDQKREVRSLARIIGLEKVASAI